MSVSAIVGREQPIAWRGCAVLPLPPFAEGQASRGSGIPELLDYAATLGGAARGNSHRPVLDELFGPYWVLAYQVQLHT